MSYIFDFESPIHDPDQAVALLGGKGHSLAVMKAALGLPVPPGFTISTQACVQYLKGIGTPSLQPPPKGRGSPVLEGAWPDLLDEELQRHMRRIEDEVGRRFGGPGEPLLVSVRSGAAVSMPGMMDTILNLGLNEETTRALAVVSGDEGFAASSWARFQSMYRRIVDSDEVPEDPWEQLRQAIEAVFRSWDSDRARTYRTREGIPDDLGTAVTVQAMVFGNLDDHSATGVLFTRNPATGERSLYGDVMFRTQGEDVVGGSQLPQPIEVLEERLPQVAKELRNYAEILERHYRDVCDIEFTIERGKLWMLQARIGKRSPQAAMRIAVEMAEEDEFPLSRAEALQRVAHHLHYPPEVTTHVNPDAELLTTGLPASPGLVSGQIATTADSAVTMADSGRPVILVRPATSPNDVHGMARVVGILTARGGMASHAAVVARGWGIPAVVGALAVRVRGDQVSIGGRHLGEGDLLTVDGWTGRVFAGQIESRSTIAPEAGKLLEWAAELGFEIPSPDEKEAALSTSEGNRGHRPPNQEAILRALLIKGFSTPEHLAAVVLCVPELVPPVVSSLVSDGLAKEAGEMIQLTEQGRSLGTSLMARDREAWGEEHAKRALEGFLPLDQKVKETVTAWQMRQVDGEPVMNDHTDAEYDRSVLAAFASVHRDLSAWLQPLTHGLDRLQTYLERLERAATRVAEGDHAYIASPWLDSYHTVWFELHEDLILLAGRTREEEAEAGRA
ncbi:MAG: pyruvate, phosphate dikinase [Acidimicrobiia bacterium]